MAEAYHPNHSEFRIPNSEFTKDITFLRGVGERRAKLFAKLGVTTVGALLRFYPRAYEDWSSHGTVFQNGLISPDQVHIKARISGGVEESRIRQGMTLYKVTAVDDDGTKLRLTFFNNPYTKNLLRDGEDYVLHGKISFDYNRPEMSSPAFLPLAKCGVPLAVYPQTEGLPSRVIAAVVAEGLRLLPEDLPDPIPEEIRAAHGLCGLREAIFNIHAPKDMPSLNIARKRLVFEEFLTLQLGLFILKSGGHEGQAPMLDENRADDFFAMLPFAPTDAQRRAVDEAMGDMTRNGRPMLRLLQGDVGSGKTAVAAALCYCAAKCGLQSALMAPTEILAEQHYVTLRGLLEGSGVEVRLLTGSVKAAERTRIYAALADGTAHIAVGTHALISEGVSFHHLGLVITDEQHRFGVSQRTALAAKGSSPHLLVMSATPIPRTLALMMFGDMDISVLDELPGGRIPVETYWIRRDKLSRAYQFTKKFLDEGRQAFIVCPLVEEGESANDTRAATDYAAALSSGEFAGYSGGLLHGKMKPADKEHVMRKFTSGETQLLVSTTVVEVGVDVPNAAVMIIENAERFGLAQLHQLRGRVGRSLHKSYCILVSDSGAESAAVRFKTMERTADGFEIAAMDLKLRGPGDFFGARQHGLPNLRISDLEMDMSVLSQAQVCASEIIASDPDLSSHSGLRAEVERLWGESGMTI